MVKPPIYNMPTERVIPGLLECKRLKAINLLLFFGSLEVEVGDANILEPMNISIEERERNTLLINNTWMVCLDQLRVDEAIVVVGFFVFLAYPFADGVCIFVHYEHLLRQEYLVAG